MLDAAQWIEKNRPEGDPDYSRLADVTDAIESEMRKTGPERVLDRRFTYDTATRFGVRRIEEVFQEAPPENPDQDLLLNRLANAWSEGFIFGSLAYSREGRGRRAEAFLDRVALVNIDQLLSTADDDARSRIFADAVSTKALLFVSTARSIKTVEILSAPSSVWDHQAVKGASTGQWLDGFLVGLVFQELGGHRDQ